MRGQGSGASSGSRQQHRQGQQHHQRCRSCILRLLLFAAPFVLTTIGSYNSLLLAAGFVVLESMASGVPVVAVRAGGIPDILSKQGQTGYLYAPGGRAGQDAGSRDGGRGAGRGAKCGGRLRASRASCCSYSL
jgi:hypothetical protein